MRSGLAAVGLAASLVAACASGPFASREARWKHEWNARVDSAETRWENPCGDPEFDPWARDFLAACETGPAVGTEECAARRAWVEERVTQCRAWRAYLLRNHGRHGRIDDLPEPPTRID